MKVILLLICLVGCVAVCFGQSNKTPVRPDFTGTWELDAARSNVAKSKKSSPERIKITHHDPELTIRRKVSIDGVAEERDLIYYTDGRGETNPTTAWVTTNPGSESYRPRDTKSKTTWNKTKVVTRSVSQSFASGGVFEFEIVDEWRISSDGKSLTKTTKTVPNRNLTGNAAFVIGNGTEFKEVYKLISK
ncbi:MAG TPA: hypothetical protein VN696_09670 [Pyrinomonadaceae bacterium]|nr:hypothetical protein [Pyrinomonadaceae bacterium]